MCSYERNCEKLRKLFEEVETDDESSGVDGTEHLNSENSDSEPDPFSDDGEFNGDPDYDPNEGESESESEGELEAVENPDIESFINNAPENQENWYEDLKSIPYFPFSNENAGLKIRINENSSPKNIFDELFTKDVVEKLINATNAYGKDICKRNRPKTRNCRVATFHEVTVPEMYKFLGLCLLQGQKGAPSIRHLFTRDSLYYSPIYAFTMSGRRFEQILRCFNCHMDEDSYVGSVQKLIKVSPLLNPLLANFKAALSPPKELSLDESLVLFRGRLSFKQYIKGKKAKYGIKFYTLTSSDGYVLSVEIYSGKTETNTNTSKTQELVLRLMQPYLNKGHHLFMDNFYNSYSLSEELLSYKTHCSGTLRSNRKGLPKEIIGKKLKKGELIWRRRGQIYVSKWKDKREVLSINTAHHPKLIETKNKYGQIKLKPIDIAHYNEHMSGVDRSDQMVSYYSSPRKTIRWYKKIIFHLLDVTVWNSFYLYKKFHNNIEFLKFRDLLIKSLINLPADKQDGRSLTNISRGRPKDSLAVSPSLRRSVLLSISPLPSRNETPSTSATSYDENHHIMEKIPPPAGYKRKTYFLRCKRCYANQRKKQTSYRCQTCPDKPVLCPECFGVYHIN